VQLIFTTRATAGSTAASNNASPPGTTTASSTTPTTNMQSQARMGQLLDDQDHKRCSEGNHRALLAENLDWSRCWSRMTGSMHRRATHPFNQTRISPRPIRGGKEIEKSVRFLVVLRLRLPVHVYSPSHPADSKSHQTMAFDDEYCR
jgi:hypothetical protein